MNLLGAKLYDPSVAVSKATSALLAMTALDTTNLRLTVTVPAHGMIHFRMMCTLEGGTTFPQILLGVLVGASVKARVSPLGAPDGTALATTRCTQYAEFTVTGLAAGSTNFDAAYGVETIVASTNIKYGGPDNTTADDAWGGFVFEAWDPQPLQTNGQVVVDANGRLDISKVAGTAQTARDLGAQLDTNVGSRMATFTLPTNFSSLVIDANGRVDLSRWLGVAINALIAGRVDASVGAMAANVLTAAAINAAALNGKGDWATVGAAMTLTGAEEDAVAAKINDAAYEGTLTLRQAVRLMLAALAGKADGLAGVTVHYRDQADSKNRITATVDANGNRTVVTVDGT